DVRDGRDQGPATSLDYVGITSQARHARGPVNSNRRLTGVVAKGGGRDMVREARRNTGSESRRGWNIDETDLSGDALPKWKEWNDAKRIDTARSCRCGNEGNVGHDVGLIAK